MLKKKCVCVSVATVWTRPHSPRYIDQLAINNPVDVKGWLCAMTTEDRRQLSGNKLIQSQVLYGETLYVIEEKEDWAHVLIPSQPSEKDDRGYPGWIPMRQLSPVPSEFEEDRPTVEVITRSTRLCPSVEQLHKQTAEECLEISFMTRLPLFEESEQTVEVVTPHGSRHVNKADVRIFEEESHIAGQGPDVVNTAKQFLNLPYLWGGTSVHGYDCSGFTYSMYRYYGKTIGRDAHDQARTGRTVTREEFQLGDLIFFAYEQGKGDIHHVGIYVGDDRMIHSPRTGKSIEIIPLTGSKYEEELIGGRRYID